MSATTDMMRRGAAIAAVLMLAACGGPEDTKDGLSAKERRDLDNAAAMLDNQVYDTSADSLVPEESGNGAAPVDNAVAGNVAATP